MGLFGKIKQYVTDIVSDEISPCVCPHCGFRIRTERIKIKCCDCGGVNTIRWVGTLPVCMNCNGHYYERFCPKCGGNLDD